MRATLGAMSTDVAAARKGLAIYLALVVVASGILEWRILAAGGSVTEHPAQIFALMWTPALASIVARLALREGLGDVSFRWGAQSTRTALVGWLYPVVFGAIAYGVAWISGLAEFAVPPPTATGHAGSAASRFVMLTLANMTVGTLLGCTATLGEEIGWRGYMLTRLFDAGIPRPVFVSGVIWSLWHVPLILSGQYASSAYPTLSAALFVVGIVSGSYLMAWVRLESGSVWPAMIAHASWNAIIQGVFDASTRGTPIWVGESGVIVALLNVATAVWLVRRPWALRRVPVENPAAAFARNALRGASPEPQA